MPLFHISGESRVQRLLPGHFKLESDLQKLTEANLLEIFGVKFIATEFILGGEQAGRIDTLGIDLEGAPTIIEYKRYDSDSVINQGLYYMDWLIEHRGDFVVAAQKALGHDVEVNWSHPRLIIVTQNYAKWDTHAVKHMGKGIELWKYVLYENNMLYLEMVYGQQRAIPVPVSITEDDTEQIDSQFTIEHHLEGKSEAIKELFWRVRDGIFEIAGEEGDIIETPNKLYIGYRHGRNFCEIQIQVKALKIFLDIPYSEISDPDKITKDVSNVGHWGTGDTEVKLTTLADVEKILNLIEQSYQRTL